MAVHLDRVQRACDERRARARIAPCPRVATGGARGRCSQIATITLGASLGVPILPLLLVAVVIGVVVAVAARRTVSSLLAGAGSRSPPYVPGEHVRVFVPARRSVQDAEIVRVGPANTTLLTPRRPRARAERRDAARRPGMPRPRQPPRPRRRHRIGLSAVRARIGAETSKQA